MAMILGAFMSNFSKILTQMVQDEVDMLLGVPREIEKLRQTIFDIQSVLVDAEEKQIKSELIKRWHLDLKDVMYDADDIMDLCQIKYDERRASLDSPSSSKLSCGCFHLFSCFRNPTFAHEIGNKIKEINVRLEGIAKRKIALGLIEMHVVVPPPHVRRLGLDSVIHRKTDPLVVMDDLVGDKIEEDAELLVGWLTEEEKKEKKGISVVAIQGMGGIGKTTLAKRIFNDPRVKEEFKPKIWACVSKEAKGVELLKSIIQQAGGAVGGVDEREVLVPMLVEIIKGKKCLLVLDDVWLESMAVWNKLLRDVVNGGGLGSKLLVTTRDERVANGMKATNIHRVNELSDEDGWSLLKKQVFENEEDSEIEEFKKIGLQLVRNCDGLPLAIKSIGGVLCLKSKTIPEWDAVLRSSVWSTNELPDEIHHALYLSYEDLSSALKQCFIICSIYPEDYTFIQDDLVYHWIAEGFLQDTENPWEQGVEYYKELLLRNLLEVCGDYESKMHDLLWSFTHHLGKDENCILPKGQVLNRQGCLVKLRRLSTRDDNMNLEDVKKEKTLRTLFFKNVPENALTDMRASFPNLRILVLKDSRISTLPYYLSSLVHLRYFDISYSSVTTIPDTIGLLKNLIYLNFDKCDKLAHVSHNITNLKKLMHLSCFRVGSLEGIPSGLKFFKKLTHLNGFKPNNNGLTGLGGLEELGHLSHLVVLRLEKLERVSDINTAKRAKLCCKEHLQFLGLEFTDQGEEYQVSQPNEKKVIVQDVLNELCPPSSVESLRIDGYFGSTLPNWLNLGANFLKLRELRIINCNCFESLAPLGQLPNLELLRIDTTSSIETIGEEFLLRDIKKRDATERSCSIGSPAFPKVTILMFENLSNWKEWKWNKGESAMPKLKQLTIWNCPQLKYLPEGLSQYATSLKYLNIVCAPNLAHIDNFSSVQYIIVYDNQNLERILNLSSVSYVEIYRCPNLKTMENLPALQKMELHNYHMEVLPEFLTTITPLKLKIESNKKLLVEIASQGENGSEWHKFKHIPNVTFYSSDEKRYATYQKTPFSFTIHDQA